MAAARKAKQVSAPATSPKKKRVRRNAASPRFVPLTAEHFSPFAEADLLALVERLEAVSAQRQRTLLAQSEIGATLIGICGDVDAVLAPLLSIWASDGLAADDHAHALPAP